MVGVKASEDARRAVCQHRKWLFLFFRRISVEKGLFPRYNIDRKFASEGGGGYLTDWEELSFGEASSDVPSPFEAENVDLTKVTSIDYDANSDATITENTLAGTDASFTINVTGKVAFTAEAERATIYIDGVAYEITTDSPFVFKGEVVSPIKVSVSMCTVSFVDFCVFNTSMLIDAKGNAAFGDFFSHSFYGSNNFASGSGNKLGSKAYHIISFSGTNDSIGYYYLDGTNEDAQAIQALLDAGEGLGITIRNGHWLDNHCKILSVFYNDEEKLRLEVDNFYTNMANGMGYTYDSNFVYSSKGQDPYNDFPELGYAVQNGTAYLFIVGHPEFGSFEMCRDAAAVGLDNASQNDFTFSSGWNNVSNGRYSATMGNSNRAGYCSLAVGISNDGSKAQNSVIAGYYNEAMKHIECVMMLGKKLRGGYNNQVILGCYNNNKEENAVEIGGGNGNRFNVFEVKKNGAIATNEKYYPGSKIGKFDVSQLSVEENNGNRLSYSDIATSGLVRIHNVTTAPNSATGTTKAIYPSAVYYKPNNMPYFAYIRINADPLGTNNGLKLANGKYILAYDMNIISADNLSKTSIAGLYKPYADVDLGSGAGKDRGFGGIIGKFKLGVNRVYVPLEIDEQRMEIGVYHTSSGDTAKTDAFEFEISNFRLYKAVENTTPIATEKALTYSGNIYLCIDGISINDIENPEYIGCIVSGKEYLAASNSPAGDKEIFYAASEADISFISKVKANLEVKDYTVLKSSSPGSSKQFKLSVDDTGTLSVTEL